MEDHLTMANAAPIISIVMSVLNGEPYVAAAIESILKQTFTDFEFIIINDGSTDNTESTIKKFKDPRIRLFTQKNQGLTASLNRGLQLAKGTYIARQDADDISYPDRLQELVSLFNDKTVLVSGSFDFINDDGLVEDSQVIYDSDTLLKRCLFVRNPFAHGNTIYRRSAALEVGGYSPKVGPVEDYDLWLRLADIGDFKGCPNTTYGWKLNEAGISHQNAEKQTVGAAAIKHDFQASHTLPVIGILEYLRHFYGFTALPKHLRRIAKKQLVNEQAELRKHGSASEKVIFYLLFPYNFTALTERPRRFFKRLARHILKKLGRK